MALTPQQVVEDTQLLLEGHLACPTCPARRPRRCCSCNVVLSKSEERLAPDPYAAAVDGDARPHLQCPTCIRHSAINAQGHK